VGPTRCNSYNLLIFHYLNMSGAILCPSSGALDCVLQLLVFGTQICCWAVVRRAEAQTVCTVWRVMLEQHPPHLVGLTNYFTNLSCSSKVMLPSKLGELRLVTTVRCGLSVSFSAALYVSCLTWPASGGQAESARGNDHSMEVLYFCQRAGDFLTY
jgi:hypothetical protein